MIFSSFELFNIKWQKICFWCGSANIKKNGQKRNKQLYKCKGCGKQFVNYRRLDDASIIRDYIDGKQTLLQLSEKYNVCIKTIWNHLSNMRHIRKISSTKDIVVLIDTTYWGRDFGLMIIKDAFRNKILWYKFVRHETIADYREGVDYLRANGFKIFGIVCDGMRGLFKEFIQYRVQMRQFHMISIVKRYLTMQPDIEASKELLCIVRMLSKIPSADFNNKLEDWRLKWESFMKERSVEEISRKTRYTHANLRRAYLSLVYYKPYLWTFERYSEFNIPKTNAGIESLNGRLKTMLRIHSGVSKERRIKLIKEYMSASL